LKTAIFS
jgi:ribosomal protein L32